MMALLVLMIGFLLLAANAQALTFTAGSPGTSGTNIVDQFKVTFNDGTTATLMVPITSGLTDIGKADKIATAVANSRRDGAKVTLPAKVTKFEQTVNQSGEKGTVASLSPGIGSVGFNLPLTGLTPAGTTSTFQTSLGFSLASVDVTAASNIPFSNLTSPTLNGLLTDTFIQLRSNLPLTFQSSLSLDLVAQAINFNFPNNATNAFVSSFTNDLTTQATVGLSEIPEPSEFILMASGLTGLIVMRLLQRARHTTA